MFHLFVITENSVLVSFLAELLQTAKLFKWKYFWVKSIIFSQDLEVCGILIGQYSDHMTKQ